MRERLDVALVRRGLTASRSEARLAVEKGLVTVGGRPAAKTAMLVGREESVVVSGPARRFVSRGGEKLQAALERFDIPIRDRRCVDVGASTGGFTDCLIQAGAGAVIAIDVGYGQFDWALRNDPRVIVLERTNVRDVDPVDLPYLAEIVVADLSFISLRTVMPALVGLSIPGAYAVVLIKPQFEAGRGSVDRGGVVRDPGAWRRSIEGVVEAAAAQGVMCDGVCVSPLVGPAGNVEFLFAGRRGEGADTAEPIAGLDAALADAEALREAS
ncbi:MAG: TlyA family RNA methyltransferase [Actinomycetota bacterium]